MIGGIVVVMVGLVVYLLVAADRDVRPEDKLSESAASSDSEKTSATKPLAGKQD